MAEALRRALLGTIRAYRAVVSPLLGPACRFYPSCSAYAAGAIERHGLLKGSELAAKRILRCSPWHPGGVDLVPGCVPPRGRALGTPRFRSDV